MILDRNNQFLVIGKLYKIDKISIFGIKAFDRFINKEYPAILMLVRYYLDPTDGWHHYKFLYKNHFIKYKHKSGIQQFGFGDLYSMELVS